MDATLNELALEERTIKLRQQNVARVRRCRQRKKERGRVVPLDIPGSTIDQLIGAGVLGAAQRDEVDALRRAVARLFWVGLEALQAKTVAQSVAAVQAPNSQEQAARQRLLQKLAATQS
jgi:hypothetical protein